jgi:hypothetical protein
MTDVCFVPSSIASPSPMGIDPNSTLFTCPEDRRAALSPSCRMEDDLVPPADLMSQHLTVESRPPDTRTDDSAEKDNEVMAP